MEEFDVIVIGGGPAGATVALGLAREGRRVALLEAQAHDAPRYGETLPPEINPVLRDLKLSDAFQALSPLMAPGMISSWGDAHPVENDFVRNVHGPGWHIDRRRFDDMLLKEAAAAGVLVFSPRRAEAWRRNADDWRVAELRARILVDASGRNGLRIEGSGDRETEDVLLAIAMTVSYSGQPPRDLRTCIETTKHGWWYTAPVPDAQAVAMFFTDPEIYRQEGISIPDQLKVAPLTAKRLEGGKIQDTRVLRVASSCRKSLCGHGWLALGDSASSYDPLSGRGIFKALRHACSAIEAIVASLGGNNSLMLQYANQVRAEFDAYVHQRRLYYASELRWSKHSFWQARSR